MPKNNGKERRKARQFEAQVRETLYDTINCNACGNRHHRDWNCIMQTKLFVDPEPRGIVGWQTPTAGNDHNV